MLTGLTPRLGLFLILVGLGCIIIFITYLLGGDYNLDFLIIGVILIYLGFRFRRNQTPNEGTRFSTIRRIKESHKKGQENKPTDNQDQKDPN